MGTGDISTMSDEASATTEAAPEMVRRDGIVPAIALAGLSAIFMWGGVDLGLGSPFRLGTGAFPFFTGLILMGLSLALFVQAIRGGEAMVAPDWIGFGAICAALAVFAVTTDRIGLVPGAFLTVMVASLPDDSIAFWRKLILAGVVSVACWILFIEALNLPFKAFAGF